MRMDELNNPPDPEEPKEEPLDSGPRHMEIPSIHQWLNEKEILNEKGDRIFFLDHMFLFEPFSDFSKRIAIKACSQVGKSLMMTLKTIHVMRAAQLNVIYTLPSDHDVQEFVPTKVDKIIQTNPSIKIQLTEDNVFRKGLFGRFLYYKGTRSKTAAIMTSADVLVHDEVDRSEQGVIEDYRSRIQFSKYGGIWQISNPSFKNTGIDIPWKRSTQKEWVVRCNHCKAEQILSWEKNIDHVRKVYQCRECGTELTDNVRRKGRWVAANPESEISGYHISQMMAPWRSAKDLLTEEMETDEEYFSNFILGEPIGEGDAEDFRRLIMDAWTPKDLRHGPYFMGVDIGSTKHYVIGNREGIFEAGKLKTRQELERLIEEYNPIIVMDAGPERTWAEEFRLKYPKLWINFYKRDKDRRAAVEWGEDDKQGVVSSDRSRVIDATVTAIVYADILFDLEPEVLNPYIKHWLTMVKKREIDGLGLARFVWDKNTEHAQDHWVHATVYYWIARMRGAEAVHVPVVGEKQKPIIQVTDGGTEMRDLKDYMEERDQ